MTGLETAFYILGIIFMSLMLLIAVAMVAALFVIRAKINSIHDHIERRLNQVSELAEKGGAVIGAIKKVTKATKR